MTPGIESLRARNVLGPLDEHCARTLARLAGEERALVLLAVALASRQVGLGHVCLDLPALTRAPRLLAADGEPVDDVRWPRLEGWLAELRSSPLVGAVTDDERRPLVLDDAGRLYLRRYFEHEARLADAIRERAGQSWTDLPDAALEAALDRLFAASASAPGAATTAIELVRRPARAKPRVAGQLELLLTPAVVRAPDAEAAPGALDPQRAPARDLQREAARTAATRRLCVISGGPGTGKTSTVVKILALLAERHARSGAQPLRALLLAPTGKAAMRLTEAIRRAKADVPCDDAIRATIPEEASTIHRALGSIDGSSTRFRHDRARPLRADVVLVDEASMVDLALMRRLVDAVPPEARLILLGDKDQLASVEAGAVLGELCGSGGPEGPQDGPLAASIVELTRSYRYRPGSGIEALAGAINAGDAAGALAILDDPGLPDVTRVEPTPDAALSEPLRRAAVEGFRHALREVEPAERLRALERFRILCAHRHGPHGVLAANAEIEALLVEAGLIVRDVALAYVGRPVIITRNDYQLQLFNGDVGTIVEIDGKRLAFFVGPDGAPRFLSPARLPQHETVFAMTVHKSQGSEFDRVAVLLGGRSSPLLTRELVYTAVTRARHAVALHATAAVVAEAIGRRTERGSGLRDALTR